MIIEALSIGFYEEILFRGLVFIIYKEKFKNSNILIPIILSSILFGLINSSNLKNDISFNIVLYQFMYTFIIEFLLNSILIKIECNIIWISILHSFYDIVSEFEDLIISHATSGSISTLTILFFIPIFIYSIYIIKKKPSNY